MKDTIIMFFKEILLRIKSESPKLFKRITWLCLAMATVGAALKVQEIDWVFYQSATHPENTITLVNLLIGAGVAGGAVSSLTAKNTEPIEEMKKKNKK